MTGKKCNKCLHYRVCYLHRKFSQFIGKEIKPNPNIHQAVALLVERLAESCKIYNKGDPYA